MSMTYTTTEAARGRDADWERRHGLSSADVTTVWDFDGGQSLELTVGELEEYEQAEGVTLDEDIIGPQRFASLLEWLREEELLEQPVQGSPAPKEQQAQHTPGPWRIGDAGRTIFGPPTGNPSPKTVARLPKVAPPCKVSDLDESVANAFLIAAAPELLAALERLYAMGEWQRTIADEMGATVGNAYSAARAAIAKAKGGAL